MLKKLILIGLLGLTLNGCCQPSPTKTLVEHICSVKGEDRATVMLVIDHITAPHKLVVVCSEE